MFQELLSLIQCVWGVTHPWSSVFEELVSLGPVCSVFEELHTLGPVYLRSYTPLVQCAVFEELLFLGPVCLRSYTSLIQCVWGITHPWSSVFGELLSLGPACSVFGELHTLDPAYIESKHPVYFMLPIWQIYTQEQAAKIHQPWLKLICSIPCTVLRSPPGACVCWW